MKTKPILFVDIDGVLNPFGFPTPPGFVEHHLFPEDDEPIRLNPAHCSWLGELANHFDLVWATGWPAEDREVLLKVHPLPAFAGTAAMPPVPFDPERKIDGVSAYATDKPAAWIDDVMTPAAHAWAESRPEPTLLVETASGTGMQQQHVDQLLEWVGRV